MKIIILDQAYPDPESDSIGDPFVHVRAKYFSETMEVVVFKTHQKERLDYTFDGIFVKCTKGLEEFEEYLLGFNPQSVVVHFVEPFGQVTFRTRSADRSALYCHAVIRTDCGRVSVCP